MTALIGQSQIRWSRKIMAWVVVLSVNILAITLRDQSVQAAFREIPKYFLF